MENKKQLVIVPPMSEPLQKLNEVLNGIADDENIEISTIDDGKELSQYMGSAGQSLVVFSNAKKCALFLQENRFIIAKSHSKVILLTPKEIPAKTLTKFVKIGLTESILESSPPKTLLYKVKLLLRSIKSTSAQEDKDQVVKSMLDANASSSAKGEADDDKEDTKKEESLNYLSEERLKNKKDNVEESSVDYGGSLKGKNNFQEESIDTNWKSKRNTDAAGFVDDDNATDKIESDDPSSIDMYYRGKKKRSDQIENLEEESIPKSFKQSDIPDEEDKKKKKTSLIDLEIEEAQVDRKKRMSDDEDDNMSLKTNKAFAEVEEAEPLAKERHKTEEQKAEEKKKEFEELEALFEAAKKRQTMKEEDLGGHLKGKLNTTREDDEEEDELEQKKEYDNSDLYQKEKQLDLDLIESAPEKRQRHNEDDAPEAKDPHEGAVDKIDTNMQSDKGSTDKINTRMMSEMSEDPSKKLSTRDIFERDTSKNEGETDDGDSDGNNRGKKELEAANDETPKEKKDIYQKENTHERKKQTELDLEDAGEKSREKALKDEDSNEVERERPLATNLTLLDGEDKDASGSSVAEDPHMAFKKLNQTDLDIDNQDDRKRPGGKVDKIDTFYRSGEAKKTEHSWDNLSGRIQTEAAAQKGPKKADEIGHSLLKKDNGEVTIDYRKLKEEFDFISKNGNADDSISSGDGYSSTLKDSEDAGSFKVIEVDARGFEFGIEMVNLIYQKESKPVDFYKKVAEELISYYKAFPVFYTYKVSDKKHVESFDSFMQFGDTLVPTSLKEWWINAKVDQDMLNAYFEKSMTTWMCREIKSKTEGNEGHWEDVELPSWATNELVNKKVEMIFPYFDGVDRMGVAVLYFPDGVKPSQEKSILVTLEMVRTIMLDSIQRATSPVTRQSSDENDEAPKSEKKNIVSLFSGLFNRNKAS